MDDEDAAFAGRRLQLHQGLSTRLADKGGVLEEVPRGAGDLAGASLVAERRADDAVLIEDHRGLDLRRDLLEPLERLVRVHLRQANTAILRT
jgi:hypothetical protein